MVEQQTQQNDNFQKVRSQLVEVELTEHSFSRIAEVLTRIGIPSYKTHTLFQSAHILHKRHKYYIAHFKSLLALDGRPVEIAKDDLDRVSTIANMLQQWGLCKVIDNKHYDKTSVLVIPRSEKSQWTLAAKYTIGHYKHYKGE